MLESLTTSNKQGLSKKKKKEMKVNRKESLSTQKLLLGKEEWKYFDSVIDH